MLVLGATRSAGRLDSRNGRPPPTTYYFAEQSATAATCTVQWDDTAVANVNVA
jgi:hypothetical protein